MRPRTRIAGFLLALSLAGASTAEGQPTGRTLPINGIDMYVEQAGEGPPLLLLHDFGGCGAAWEPFRDALAAEHRLIVADLRGQGRSTNPGGEFTHRQAADDVFALLDSLGIERVRAIGMSSGGMTLLHMATRRPERVEAMVLVGATTHFPEPARAFMRRSVPDSLSADELAGWGRCSARGEAQTHEVLEAFHSMKDSYDDMNFTAPYLGTITARTLVVHGDRDEYFPVYIPFEMYESIPGSALWIVPNGDHLPVYGPRVDAFIDEVRRFFAE